MSGKKDMETKQTELDDLLDSVVGQAEIEDAKLQAAAERWKELMKRQAFLESEFNISVHSITGETQKTVEEFLQLLLELDLLEARYKLLNHRIKQKRLAIDESIELVDGFEIDTDKHEVLPAAMMVGVPNEELKNRVYAQLYRYSMVCIGKEEDAGEIDLLTRYEDWPFISNLTVGRYVKGFEDMVKKMEESGDGDAKGLIDQIINDESTAEQVARKEEYPALRAFAILTLYFRQQEENNGGEES